MSDPALSVVVVGDVRCQWSIVDVDGWGVVICDTVYPTRGKARAAGEAALAQLTDSPPSSSGSETRS
jgi:hypothetical protein